MTTSIPMTNTNIRIHTLMAHHILMATHIPMHMNTATNMSMNISTKPVPIIITNTRTMSYPTMSIVTPAMIMRNMKTTVIDTLNISNLVTT